MSNERIRISRRKALVGLGSIGLASAGAGLGTYAQFTDTESGRVTFTSGEIDGEFQCAVNYNGDSVKAMDEGFEELTQVDSHVEAGPGCDINFTDIKPGDFGSILFKVTVRNNPAWVASCLGYGGSAENGVSDAEQPAEDKLEGQDYGGEGGKTYSASQNPSGSGIAGHGPGEVEENLYLMPFYHNNKDEASAFFDQGLPGQQGSNAYAPQSYADATSAAFWDSREGSPEGLAPMSLHDIAWTNLQMSTIDWGDNGGSAEEIPSPGGMNVGNGCVFVDGGQATQVDDDEEIQTPGTPSGKDDTREASPLQPGTALYFGYDWLIPFQTGNEMQSDSVEMKVGFTFSQTRHAESITMQNTYAPGNNT